ncbi:MAG: hypothetical protein AB1689_17705 [Thermodesulfobacteriota bacterium]
MLPMEPIVLYRREWGDGQPVIAMHPLGLESSAFEGFGRVLARHGMRTIAVDLPGFGRTPMPAGRLTPAVLEPDLEDASGVCFVTRGCVAERTAAPVVPALGGSHGA